MASYEELYNMILEESVKGSVGRAGLKTISAGKAVVKTGSKISDSVRTGYNKSKEIKVIGPAIKTAEKATTIPFEITSGAIANGITKGKEIYIKSKYSDKPEQLESKLKKNIDDLSKLKSDIMAIEIWTVGWPLAIKSAGLLDNVFKSIILAGAIAKEDKELTSAVAKAALWVPALVATVSKIANREVKPNDKDGNFIKRTTTKLLDMLESWAKSDQPLFIYKKGPQFKSAKFNKKEQAINEFVSLICESIINEDITCDEAAYLFESLQY